jgi:hypothetical protein
VGACDPVLSYQAFNVVVSRGLGPSCPLSIERPQVRLPGDRVHFELGYEVYSGQAGGEILYICVYRDEIEDWYGSLLDLIPFRLAAPPLQSGVVGPYLIRSV